MLIRLFSLKIFTYTVRVVFLCAVFPSFLIHSQTLPILPQQFDTSRERPDFNNSKKIQPFNFKIQSPERSPIPKAIDSVKFYLGDLTVEGASAFDVQDFKSLYSALYGKEIVLEDIRKVADQIEELYRKKGFFLTRVFLPPQQVKNGVFKIKVIEGYIGSVEVEGGTDEIRQEVYSRLDRLTTLVPIDLSSLERALLLLNDLPDMQVSGLLRAGKSVGESDLVVQIESDASGSNFNINNSGSPSVGPTIASMSTQIASVVSLHDALRFQFSTSVKNNEMLSVGAIYSKGVGVNGAVASVAVTETNVKPGGEFQDLQLVSHSSVTAARLTFPIIRSRQGSVYVEAGSTDVATKSSQAGNILTDEETVVDDLRFRVTDWRTVLGSISAGLGISSATSVSINAANPSVNDFDPKLKKISFNIKDQIGSESPGLYSEINIQGQYASKPLLNSERIAFGSDSFGRGFSPSTLVGDKGLGSSLELGYGSILSLPFDSGQGIAKLYAFIDHAVAVKNLGDGISQAADYMTSTGLGLKIQTQSNTQLNFYIANPYNFNGISLLPTQKAYLSISFQW